jgi:hypothetical protein
LDVWMSSGRILAPKLGKCYDHSLDWIYGCHLVGCWLDMSENQIITNHHYYAHFSLFLCAPKNSADRHSWMTLQWLSTAFFKHVMRDFMYLLYDYC